VRVKYKLFGIAQGFLDRLSLKTTKSNQYFRNMMVLKNLMDRAEALVIVVVPMAKL
jgi:hypothetical protein